MTPLEETAKEWFDKAERDFQAAKICGKAKLFDISLFHCQQLAEKSLKGFLAYHNKPIDKTHKIEKLLEQAERIESGFILWKEAGKIISEYAVLSRYPDSRLDVSKKAYTNGLSFAKKIYEHTLSVLPKVVRSKTPPKKRRSTSGSRAGNDSQKKA